MNVRVTGKLREIRDSKGLSRSKLAETCGISPKTLQRAENGNPIRLKVAERLAEILSVDISRFVINEDNLTAEQKEIISCEEYDAAQIVAGPGSGKTKTLVEKVVYLIQNGVSPKSIVIFAFTEKAANELNYRIKKELKNRKITVPGIAEMYIGTIHGFCLFIIKDILSLCKDYEVLTPVRTRLFVDRNFNVIGVNSIKKLASEDTMRIYTDTNKFLEIIATLNENKVDWEKVPAEIMEAFKRYGEVLNQHKFLDFTTIMSIAYKELIGNEILRSYVRDNIKYLIVDEYQDVNFLQEKIISTIHNLGSKLLVVGDLDQCIYTWRGSDVENFLKFDNRYKNAKKFFLGKNFRSSNAVVDIANKVIKNNVEREHNLIIQTDNTTYDIGDCIYKEFNNPELESEFIVDRIKELSENAGVPYSEMAILVRTNKLANNIIEELERKGVPYIVQGVNKLFETKEIKACVAIFKFLCKKEKARTLERLWIDAIPDIKLTKLKEGIDYLNTIDLNISKLYDSHLLQRVYWDFLGKLDLLDEETPIDHIKERILYNLGKFSQVINDFESINYKVIPVKRFNNFCKFAEVSADDYYPEGYLENPYIKINGVRVMTIHQAKGLEFAAVFVPGLSNNILPHQRIGGLNRWHYLPEYCVKNSTKFRGGDEESERRLFYVAITRSKKFLILTRAKYGRNSAKPSPFLKEAKKSYYIFEYMDDNNLYDNIPKWRALSEEDIIMTLSFTTLYDYYGCPFRFKLSHLYGFVQPIDKKMNYGKSMHSIVSTINKAFAVDSSCSFSVEELTELAKNTLYIPYLDKSTIMYENLERKCINSTLAYYNYLKADHNSEIRFVEQKIEVPITDSIMLKGRIDLAKIVNKITNEPKTYLNDFKTQDNNWNTQIERDTAFKQLLLYCLGYEELTKEKVDYIQIFNLNSDDRNQNIDTRPVIDENVRFLAHEVETASKDIKTNNLFKKCSKEKCEKCYAKLLCVSHKDAKKHSIIVNS